MDLAVSNILFLESPSGVGFSYSNMDGEDSSDDSTTGKLLNEVGHFFILKLL